MSLCSPLNRCRIAQVASSRVAATHLGGTSQSTAKPKKSHATERQQGPSSLRGQSSPHPYQNEGTPNAVLLSSFLTRERQSPSLRQSRCFKQKGHGPIKGRSSLRHKPLNGAADHAADVAYKIQHVCSKPALAGEPKGPGQTGNGAQRGG